MSKCGYGNFETVIESPNGVKLAYKIDNNFTKKLRFIPIDTGLHKITMKMGDYLLTGIITGALKINFKF